MALQIVEAARERLAGRPLVELLDDAVITLFELYPAEQKVLAALLLAAGNVLEASKLAGISEAAFKQSLDNLAARQLLTIKAGVVDLSLAQAKLRVEIPDEAEQDDEHIPQPKVVLQGVRATAFGLAKTSTNPGTALGRVYAYLYGRTTRNYAVLGKIASALGGKRAVEFFLDHMFDQFNGDPLMELLPQAIWLGKAANGQLRSDNSPDEEQQDREKLAEDRASWEARMQRWLYFGSETAAITDVENGGYNELQTTLLVRQVRLDFQRWRDEGEPDL